MARSKAQKAKRANERAIAESNRAHHARHSSNYTTFDSFKAIEQGVGSVRASRVRLHHKRTRYAYGDDNTLVEVVKVDHAPLLRVRHTTRAEKRLKRIVSLYQRHLRAGKALGMKPLEIKKEFSTCYPRMASKIFVDKV